MEDVLLIQNTRSEDSGILGTLLDNDGFKIKTVQAKKENIPENQYSLIVILGSPESANDNLPYLRKEEKLIKNAIQNETPTLGICLGSQLMAKTLGGKVYRGPITEIGFYSDVKVANHSKLFEGCSNPTTVFHWHRDTYYPPPGAQHLASSTNFENQAFQYGSGVGLQFHLEVSSEMVTHWLDNTEQALKKIPNINPNKIRQDLESKISIVNDNMKRFYKNFKTVFSI